MHRLHNFGSKRIVLREGIVAQFGSLAFTMTRRSSALLVMAVCLALFGLANMAFVSAPEAARSEVQTVPKDRVAQAAALSAAVLTVPEIAHAGNSGYALLQLGWAVFIISLGPAVLFWVYFNKPELL